MKKIVFIVFITILPGLIGGCFGQKSEDTATIQESPTPAASPSPAPSPPQPFSSTPGTTSGANIDIAGLIPSTPPSQVPIQQGRSNPFAPLPVKPQITIDPDKVSANPPPANPIPPTTPNTSPNSGTPKTSSTARTPNQSRASGSSKPSASSRNLPQPPSAKGPTALTPPPPPQPTQAEGVYVSGIIRLPSTPMAIVKAPGENVERAVVPGTFLANGQVRVKAIYAYSDNPVVILEQYGVEVAKRVGEAPIEAQAPENPDQQPGNPQQS